LCHFHPEQYIPARVATNSLPQIHTLEKTRCSHTNLFPLAVIFLKIGAAIAAGVSGLSLAPPPAPAQEDQAWLIGPQKGYTPEIGTLVSMMAFTRMQVLANVKGLSQQDLDFLLDAKANTIGALLTHLAAPNLLRHELFWRHKMGFMVRRSSKRNGTSP